MNSKQNNNITYQNPCTDSRTYSYGVQVINTQKPKETYPYRFHEEFINDPYYILS